MVFSSSVFLFLFLPVLLAIYYCPIIKKRKYKNIILVLFSIAFYAWGEPVFVLLLLINIFINYKMALCIEETEKKAKSYLIIAICYNILILFAFKYLDFAISILNGVLGSNIPEMNLPLPIGISFYSFQAISYLVDVYRKNSKAQKEVGNVALYIALFPQLIAGPIVRYETISQEISTRSENWQDISQGIARFIVGLSKKVLLSNAFGVLVDTYWSNSSLSVGMAWLLAISYTLQIYFDFSGYSDMAIGLGKVFGFHFQENFKYPYCARTITEFWRRWHISLSSWFRDYVYIPLGGNKVSRKRHFFNLFIVWLLTGIWHGANWTFVLWGMLYFVLLIIEKNLNHESKKIGIIGHIYTMFFVIIAWVIFRAVNVADAVRFLKNMFGMGADIVDNTFLIYLNSYKWYLIVGIMAALPLNEKLSNVKMLCMNKTLKMVQDVIYVIGMALLMILCIATIVKGSYNPFIYFNF